MFLRAFVAILASLLATPASAQFDQILRGLGADETADYAAGDFREAASSVFPQGVDVVFDWVGTDALAKGFDCVGRGGRAVSILVREAKGLAEKSGAAHHYVFVEPNAVELEHIRHLVESGKVKTHLSAIFPLAEVAKAHEAMEAG